MKVTITGQTIIGYLTIMAQLKRNLILILALCFCVNANATLENARRYEYFKNSGGLNDKLSPISIDDTQASDLQNVNFTLGGAIQKRQGYASQNAALLPDAVTGIYQ